MIECSTENIYYKRKRKGVKRFFTLFLIVAIVCGSVCYYQKVILKQIYKISTDFAYSYSIESVNYAVSKTLSEDLSYSNLINIEKNSNGEIVLMSANAQKVNAVSRAIERLTSENLKAKLKDGIDIPLLAFSGISILSGYGKEINFYALNVSSVVCKFSSKFESVGINQTLHSIYVDVICTVNLDVPLSDYESQCISSVLINESVIIGKVPDVYLGGKLFS